jgi:hypothetical protein
MNPVVLWPLGRRCCRRRRLCSRRITAAGSSPPDVDKERCRREALLDAECRQEVRVLDAEKSKLSTPDIDKKQRGNVATREVEEHNKKYFSALYAGVFSALAADEELATDEKSKGFLRPNADEKPASAGEKSRSYSYEKPDADEESKGPNADEKPASAGEKSESFATPYADKKGNKAQPAATTWAHFSTPADKKQQEFMPRWAFPLNPGSANSEQDKRAI